MKPWLPLLAVLLLPPARAAEADPALAGALDWLARHQSPDGHWDIDDYDRTCRQGHCTGTGTPDYDEGATALALLAFLGRGDDPAQGPPSKAIAWLKSRQAPDGCISDREIEKHLYNHELATWALCAALKAGAPVKTEARKAVDYLLACQSTGEGWRYRDYKLFGMEPEEGGNSDTPSTALALLALDAARAAGLKVPDAAFLGARDFLVRVWDLDPRNGHGRFGYTAANAFVHRSPYTATALGFLGRRLVERNLPAPPARRPLPGEALQAAIRDLGADDAATREAASLKLAEAGEETREALVEAGRSPDAEVRVRAEELLARLDLLREVRGPAVATLMERMPDRKQANLYGWWACTLALREAGGDAWKAWRDAVRRELEGSQGSQRCPKGSWDPGEDTWGGEGGRVVVTALGALCLELCREP